MKKDFIVYGQEQRDIVEAGISAVAAVLLEGSEESKRSLLCFVWIITSILITAACILIRMGFLFYCSNVC